MCDRAEQRIARKAVEAAQAEWELVQAIRLEEKVHPGVTARARALLAARGDAMALNVFDWAVKPPEPEPDLEKARALVEG